VDESEKMEDREARCAVIIHGAAATASGAAAISLIPGSDALAIMPIQIAMIAALAYEFGVDVSGAAIRSTMYASLGRILGQGGAGLLLRWTPIAGQIVRAGIAASVTEGLGWTAYKRFEAGQPLL
jgi:uncharacterized protein (DUF697 family)